MHALIDSSQRPKADSSLCAGMTTTIMMRQSRFSSLLHPQNIAP